MNNRNKALIITGIITFVAGLAALLIGGAVAGWDFVGFFRSQTFLWICLLLGAYAIAVIVIFTKDYIDKRL